MSIPLSVDTSFPYIQVHAHISGDDVAFDAFQVAIIRGLRDRDSVEAGSFVKPCEHADLCQTLEQNTWITTFVESRLERLKDEQLNHLILDKTIPFEYRLV
jgi:hypothetical protein